MFGMGFAMLLGIVLYILAMVGLVAIAVWIVVQLNKRNKKK